MVDIGFLVLKNQPCKDVWPSADSKLQVLYEGRIFEGTLDTTLPLTFISLLDENTVSAINEMINTAMKLKTSASLVINGLRLLVEVPEKLTNPLETLDIS